MQNGVPMPHIPLELINSILSRECVLFAGAGLTAESGGMTWSILIDNLKKEFNYSSPIKDNFRIMEDLFSKNQPDIVYQKIQEQLKDVKLVDPVLKLATLPWHSTFTTNYDCALENALVQSQRLDVRTIITGQEFALSGLSSEILCVKLMGTVMKDYGQTGSMVLTSGDLSRAKEERARIYDTLLAHAANLSFLFLGYSFRDGVILETIDKLKSLKGTKKKTYYALFRDKPDDETFYILQSNGVEVIIQDLKEFTNDLVGEFDKRNPKNYASKRMMIGTDVINIDTTNVSSFLSLHNPVLYTALKEEVSPESFFKGSTESFRPFELGWHYHRKEVDLIVNNIVNSTEENSATLIEVSGHIGTGRTFTILSAIYELIVNHRSIAIQISEFPANSIPSKDLLEEFVIEVEKNLSQNRLDELEHIVFWSESYPDPAVITQFEYLVSSFDRYPIHLLYESTNTIYDTSETSFVSPHKLKVNLDYEILDNEKDEIAEYLFETIKNHRFEDRNLDEIYDVINKYKRFLPILYKILYPSKISINQLIDDEYKNLKDEDIFNCIVFCSLTSSFDIKIPISLLLKAVRIKLRKNMDYADLLMLISQKGETFIKKVTDERDNDYFAIYHPFIASRISERVGKSQMDDFLMVIAETFDFYSPLEADIISKLLIFKGVNRLPSDPSVFTDVGLENSLLKIIDRKPSRLILHHLARYYDKENINQQDVIPLLKKALAKPDYKDCLEEKQENVLTTLANIEWKNHKQHILKSNDKTKLNEIISFLIQARGNDEKNVYAYGLHARIFHELSSSVDEPEKSELITQSIEVINEGLDYCKIGTTDYDILNDIRIKILAEYCIESAEVLAKEMLESTKNGMGYYILACAYYYEKKDPAKALIYLNNSLKGDKYPAAALSLKIELLLEDTKFAPNYKQLVKLMNLHCSLQARDTWKSAYHKGVISFIDGKERDSAKYFNMSRKMAPSFLSRSVKLFWMDSNHRRMFSGIIEILEQNSGFIYGHTIHGITDDIFFNPAKQDYRTSLKEGLHVNFEIGFSPMGSIAFDVRPQKRRTRDN